ncbi:MAG: extracellular solute-binding protein [Treponema sp.]|jgi:putative aldouronate transport system substrate-binding protein|nr:extracellular solute-binding protein [Treponema sp.]
MMKKRILAVLLVLFTVSALFAGGSQAGRGTSGGTGGSAATTTPLGSYPLKTDVTLSYWLTLSLNISPNFSNLGDTPFGKALQEKTGVKINFLHPPTGSNADREQLNLMIADGSNLPDILEYNWLTSYPGGPEKAIADGVILKLNDIIDQYCPNLKAYLKAHPEFDRMVKTDDGSYYSFPFIRGEEILWYSQGLMIRKDWLDELGLQPPDTMDDWHTVLSAFKTRKNIPSPFTQVFSNNQRMFVTPFNIMKGWYISADDNKIHFGQIEPGYRRWMETMAQWYKEGLIDQDIATIQTAQQNQKMTAGTAGATVASVGSGMGTWTASARPGNPKYEIMALPDPVLSKGAKRTYAYVGQAYGTNATAAISGSCKNVEIAARFLDWGFSQAGHLFYNFGIEGESYTMVNGKPTYTDAVMKHPSWSVAQALSAYLRSTGSGPFVQDGGYITQYYALPEQKLALTNYAVAGAGNYILPPITATQDESRELATIMNEINTYCDELMTKVILGTETINDASWNNFVNTVRRMSIDRAIAIQTGAIERYKAR